ncbi:ABC transporter substrate-binding protein [Caldicellulosiruptoraceae bacterium PP1]
MRRNLRFIALLIAVIFTFGVAIGNVYLTDAASAKLYHPLKVMPEASKPITFTMFNAETNPNDDRYQSPVAKEIKRLTGVTLKVEYNVDAGSQRLQLMAASGDVPDLLFAKGDLTLFKDANLLVQLDDLINKYGPNIKKAFGDNLKRLKWSKDDPHIYALGITTDNDASLDVNGGFMLQHRVVMSQNYPTIRTVKDFENAISKYYKANPQTDGMPTIPLTLSADNWRTVISVTNPAFQATGAPDDGELYVDPKTYKVQFHYKRPAEREYFRWLNHMWNVGLLDKETFVQKDDTYKAKIASGRVLALIDAGWAVGEPITALRNAKKYDKMYGYYPVTTNTKILQPPPDVRKGYTGGWGVSITSKCKDKIRAIKFLDWMTTEDSNILRNWGIENVHYKYVNGKRVFIDSVKQQKLTDPTFGKKTGIGVYTYPFPRLPNTYIDKTGNPTTPDITKADISKNYTDVEKKVLSAYKVQIWKDLFPKPETYPVKVWGDLWMHQPEDSEIKTIASKTFDYATQNIAKVIMAKPEKFDQAYTDFLKGFDKLNGAKYEKAMEQLIKEKIELWTK